MPNREIKESRRTWRRALLAFALAAGAGFWGPSCGADRFFDCQSVCSRYRDCFDGRYDVDGCRSRCTEEADRDIDYKRRADDCEACIDDRSCTSATFSCFTTCAGIVP
jgi:hypothetical protein